MGYSLLPASAPGKSDCCDKKHDATVDLDFFSQLEISGVPEGRTYRCRIYGTSSYPELCEQFNCVSWAKANETYSERNALLVSAQRALNRLRDNGVLSQSLSGLHDA